MRFAKHNISTFANALCAVVSLVCVAIMTAQSGFAIGWGGAGAAGTDAHGGSVTYTDGTHGLFLTASSSGATDGVEFLSNHNGGSYAFRFNTTNAQTGGENIVTFADSNSALSSIDPDGFFLMLRVNDSCADGAGTCTDALATISSEMVQYRCEDATANELTLPVPTGQYGRSFKICFENDVATYDCTIKNTNTEMAGDLTAVKGNCYAFSYMDSEKWARNL